MRRSLPRNLEDNQKIFALTYEQILILGVLLIILAETSSLFGWSRSWALGLVIGIGLCLQIINRRIGFEKLGHIWSFVMLPDGLETKEIGKPRRRLEIDSTQMKKGESP